MIYRRHPAAADVAAVLGISRRSLYRWAEEGRLPVAEWGYVIIGAVWLPKRARGPKKDPRSKRYHEGRHTFRTK